MEMEEQSKRGTLGFHMLELPVHILWDIFLNLPPPSLIRTSSVCSTFRNIVSDPTFGQLYYSRSPTSCLVLSDHHRLSSLDCSSHTPTPPSPSSCAANFPTTSTSYSSLSGIDPVFNLNLNLNLNLPNPTPTPTRFISFHNPMKLLNSSHGLLCLRSHSLYFVCNPLLGEVLTLPPPPSSAAHYAAFGYDPLTQRYKLLQIVPKPDHTVAELYQLGEDTWRVIDNASSAKVDSSFDPSLNGALHWITNSTRVSELISSFDLHTEEFKSITPPSHFNADYMMQVFGLCVGVLKGSLCLCYVNGDGDDARFETWLMVEYGVEGSWTRAFAIDIKSYCGLSLGDKHRPIGFSTCGDMWLKADSGSDPNSQCLVSYNAQKRIFRHIEIGIGDIVPRVVEAVPHVFSFVSLKDFVHFSSPHLRLQIITPAKHYWYHNSTVPMHHFI